MVVHTYNSSTWKAKEDYEFQVSLSPKKKRSRGKEIKK
jgi:hypothetical protein